MKLEEIVETSFSSFETKGLEVELKVAQKNYTICSISITSGILMLNKKHQPETAAESFTKKSFKFWTI
uniref:Peptidase S1 domain-containing protein n=1 Tax=Parascaris univalens TaxID=6257 RepID=A0A915C8M8_PARUN